MAIYQFSFEPAVHENINLLVGLSAASGGGKSHSALRLAHGLRGEGAGPICFIDTDNGRGKALAPAPGQEANPEESTYSFQYLSLPPPFDPERYLSAVEAAAILGPSVIIIDNMTDEWNGEGGMLEQVDEAAGKSSFGNWKEPKRKHKRLMARLRQLNCHLIITLMAEDKMALKGGGGTPVHIGWTPICCKTPPLPRDLTFHFFVGHEGVPGALAASREEFDHAKAGIGAHGLVRDGELATEEVGRRLALWALEKGGTNVG